MSVVNDSLLTGEDPMHAWPKSWREQSGNAARPRSDGPAKKFPKRARFPRNNHKSRASNIASGCCDRPKLITLGNSEIPALYEDGK